ncbi:MAG: glutamate-5-semialdehyde dehydrogenase [Bacteroidota bacterium]
MSYLSKEVVEHLQPLRRAANRLANTPEETINACLFRLADLIESNMVALLTANEQDLNRMASTNPKYDRLLLNEARLEGIANDLRRVASLPSPLGDIQEERQLRNGLLLRRVSVPIGVVGIVFESRPNVTFDVFALTLKSGNVSVLKGSRDAADSNLAIKKLIDQALEEFALSGCCYLAPPEREALTPILQASNLVDVIIPRGSQGLIDYVRQNATVPVIETGAGICHTYIDAAANIDWATKIVTNAKARRVSVCNALDCLLIHQDQLGALPTIVKELGEKYACEIFADVRAYNVLSNQYSMGLLNQADPAHFGTEFLSMRMAIKTVDTLDDALEHIAKYGSRHSEAIVSDNQENINRFLQQVDAAAIYANTSTAYTDGGEFDLGAEIGISTQKLHARGPMGLKALTSYKYLLIGTGQVR